MTLDSEAAHWGNMVEASVDLSARVPSIIRRRTSCIDDARRAVSGNAERLSR